MSTIRGHLSLPELLAYWLGEGDAHDTDAADDHLMHCDRCGAALDELIALGAGVREVVNAGAVAMVTSGAFLRHLSERGLRVREYRAAPGGSVNCTVRPDDEVLVARLSAPLQAVQRLDLRTQVSVESDLPDEQQDIPFDPAAGEVLVVSDIARLRRLPAHTMQFTLLAVDAEGSRELGRYTFNHTP